MTQALKLAAQKALEAMKGARPFVDAHTTGWINVGLRETSSRRLTEIDDAMIALRSALQHQEEREPVLWANEGGLERVRRAKAGYVESPLLTVNATSTDLFTIPLYATPPLLQKEEGKPSWVWRAFGPDTGWNGTWGPWRLSSYKPPRPADEWFQVIEVSAAIATRQGEKPSV